MFSYFDDQFIYTGDTLLMCTCGKSELQVPARVGSAPIRKIGEGAFARNKTVRKLSVMEGVREISDKAFFECSLEELSLPLSMEQISDSAGNFQTLRKLTLMAAIRQNRLEQLLSESVRMQDGSFLVRPESLPKVHVLTANMHLTFVDFPSDEGAFFLEEFFPSADKSCTPEVWKAESEKERPKLQEMDVIREMIGQAEGFCPSSEQEKVTDWSFRTGRNPEITIQKKAAIFLNPEEITGQGWDFILPLHIRQDYCFYPRLQRVMRMKKNYYVYSRYYTADQGFLRMDWLVTDENGQLPDAEIEKEVYAKYKMLALL